MSDLRAAAGANPQLVEHWVGKKHDLAEAVELVTMATMIEQVDVDIGIEDDLFLHRSLLVEMKRASALQAVMEMEARRCRCCGKAFRPRPQVPDQQYCPDPACQKARKRNSEQNDR